MNSSEVSLMFSGGVDSTIAAINLSKQYRKVHLLTYCNGHGHYHMKNSRKRYEELKLKFGDKFIYNNINIEDLFKKIVLNNLFEDYKKYKSGLIWCLGCKLCMHTRSIIYNIKNGIKHMADGSSQDTSEMVEQMPVSIALIMTFYETYNIEYTVPVYEQTRQEKIRILKDLKFRMGIPLKDRFIGIQPKCVPGELYYMPYLLFNKALDHEKPLVISFPEESTKAA